MEFPTKETDVLALAERMVKGYNAHPADFPGVNRSKLRVKQTSYYNRKKTQTLWQAQVRLAGEAKAESLRQLKETMRACLKKSEVDVADNPEKLGLIGWGPKAAPKPVEPPGQPDNFRPVVEGPGDIHLAWDRPAGGGPVRNYNIERRQQATAGEFGRWRLVGAALTTEVNLSGQPRGVQLEYRVIAVNTAGQSEPGNTAAAVL